MTRMLTRDERHLLAAALDVLRANVLDQPGRRGGAAHYAILDARLRIDIAEDHSCEAWWARVLATTIRGEWPIAFTGRPERRHRERILRARLALAIRAVLRADRREQLTRRIRPLWELAPSHGGGR